MKRTEILPRIFPEVASSTWWKWGDGHLCLVHLCICFQRGAALKITGLQKILFFLWNLGEAGCFVAVVFWELFNCLNHRKWYGHILLQTWGSLWKVQNRFTTGNHWISLLGGKPFRTPKFLSDQEHLPHVEFGTQDGGDFWRTFFHSPKTNSSHRKLIFQSHGGNQLRTC